MVSKHRLHFLWARQKQVYKDHQAQDLKKGLRRLRKAEKINNYRIP